MIPIPHCAVVTSPVEGRVRRMASDGTSVAAGDIVATVETGGRSVDVRAPRAGRVAGALAGLAQPLGVGEGVLWLARA